ncbi:MAG: hypothetical protein KKG92_09145 [Gammaproteobacteria bacterium]|nr:hypothetical protein [Gammaproteobacteria bacterium]
MTVADLIRTQADALPEEMQREALDFLLFPRMKATHAGHLSGAAPEFPDRGRDEPETEPNE